MNVSKLLIDESSVTLSLVTSVTEIIFTQKTFFFFRCYIKRVLYGEKSLIQIRTLLHFNGKPFT